MSVRLALAATVALEAGEDDQPSPTTGLGPDRRAHTEPAGGEAAIAAEAIEGCGR